MAKDIPNLPGSSRLQGPSTTDNTRVSVKIAGGMSGSGKGTTQKVLNIAKGKGMKSTNPYC
jgi:hypothetical protein